MFKLLFAIMSLILVGGLISAQETPPGPTPLVGTNKADGIALPADMKVNNDEGFVSIAATCQGEVKFLVVSSTKVKYVTNANTIIVSIPCSGGMITVFAVGNVNGKLTDFVATNITIGGPSPNPLPTPPNPGPTPTPNPPAAHGPYNVTFVLDLNQATPQMAQVLNSQALRKTVTDAGNYFRILDKNNPVLAQTGLDKEMQKRSLTNAMIVQTPQGVVVSAIPIPASENDVLNTLKSLGGIK